MVILELALSVIVIVAAAQLFENGLENSTARLGKRLQAGKTNVKPSPLASIGIVLSKSLTTTAMVLSAVFSLENKQVADEIAVGIIISAPLALATLAVFVVGFCVLYYRDRRADGEMLNVNSRRIGRDAGFFVAVYAFGLIFGFWRFPEWVNYVGAAVLAIAFAFHLVRSVMIAVPPEKEPLKLIAWRSRSEPPVWLMILQAIVGLTLLINTVEYFLTAIEKTSVALKISPVFIALLLAPLVTELPSKIHLVKMIRNGKDAAAFGGVIYSLIFQSTIPIALGLVFVPWHLTGLSLFAALLTLISGVILLLTIKTQKPLRASYLLIGGIFYVIFLAAALVAFRGE